MVSPTTTTRRLCVFLLILSPHCSLSLTIIGKIGIRRSSRRSILTPTQRQRRYCSEASSSSFFTIRNAKSTNDDNEDEQGSRGRRRFLLSVPWIFLAPKVVQARGLVRFPCVDTLANSYHFLHAGTSLLQEEGIWSTNPLFLTNREDALSPDGQEQVQAACQVIIQDEASFPTIVKYSLAAACIDAADIVGRELEIGRDRLVPEFTFLDPRAIGQWDMLSKELVEPAVWAMDVDEAGNDGLGGRPPPNEDGTPHETLLDQSVRLRQLLSIMETQYSGDTILLIFPDGTGPALLSAMMAGIPYNRVHELEYAPGEIRLNVTRESTLELWKSRQGDATYAALVEQGRKRLKTLRATNEFVNMKDQKIEAERLTIAQRKIEKDEERVRVEELDRQKYLERQSQVANFQSSDSFALPSVAQALAGVAGIGAATTQIGRGGDDNDNALGDSPEKSSDAEDPISEPLAVEVREPTLTNGSLYSSTTRAAQRVNGDTNSIFDEGPSPLHPENRKRTAEKAMQDYMDEDDGGEAWLRSMAELAQSADDEEIDEPK